MDVSLRPDTGASGTGEGGQHARSEAQTRWRWDELGLTQAGALREFLAARGPRAVRYRGRVVTPRRRFAVPAYFCRRPVVDDLRGIRPIRRRNAKPTPMRGMATTATRKATGSGSSSR